MGMDCPYVAMGDTREEVMKMSKEHFMKAHPEESKEMMEKYSEKEIMHDMMKNIKEEDM